MNSIKSSIASCCSLRRQQQQLHTFNAPRRRLHTAITRSAPITTRTQLLSSILRSLPATNTQKSAFSTSSPLFKKKRSRRGRGEPLDRRITLIRYFLWHSKTPRPLRFSRGRALRHWTIHRAWNLFRTKARIANRLLLEKQYNSMRAACEALRLIGEDGLAIDEGGRAVKPPGARDPATVEVKVGESGDEVINVDVAAAARQQQDVGRWFRAAMNKAGVFDGVPIEYARLQTDTPRRDGWEHSWKRE